MSKCYFVELCAGSAAVTLKLLYNKSPIVSYSGSKRGYAEYILGHFNLPPYIEDLNVILVDPGAWGKTLNIIKDRELCIQTSKIIESWEDKCPEELWRDTKKIMETTTNDSMFTAAHLCQIAGTYGGCEIGGFKGKHKDRPNVDGFIPSRKSISLRLRELSECIGKYNVDIRILKKSALEIQPFECYVYIDPPYNKTKTKYVNNLSRQELVMIAKEWDKVGAKIIISENEPVYELVNIGWKTKEITEHRKGQNRKNSKNKEEWITYNFDNM